MQSLIILHTSAEQYSKNFVIMMYNGGAKLKVKVVRQAVSHITAFYGECINSGLDYWNGGILEWCKAVGSNFKPVRPMGIASRCDCEIYILVLVIELGNSMILSFIVILKCHDNQNRREIFNIVISPTRYYRKYRDYRKIHCSETFISVK